MSDDLDLVERFEALAAASFAPPTGTEVLRVRVERRRRRRRRRRALFAGGAIGSAILLAALTVAALDGAPEAGDEVHAGPPVTGTVPASYGTGPRLVVGVVPPELASHGCLLQDLADDGEWVTCTLGIPSTVAPDGINLTWKRGPASDEVLAAWKRGDAETVAQATGGLHGEVAFDEIGGRIVLALGETDRVDGASLGLPDRITRTYEVLIGSSMVQVNAEGVTGEQLDQVIGGLGLDPVDGGFAIPNDALPPSANAIAQGQQRLWFEPEPLDPKRSSDNGGDAAGITFVVDGERAPLIVTVVGGVDASDYVDAWTMEQERSASSRLEAIDPIEAEGRSGAIAQLQVGGVVGESGPVVRIVVAADDQTVVLVDGPATLRTAMIDIAGRTIVG